MNANWGAQPGSAIISYGDDDFAPDMFLFIISVRLGLYRTSLGANLFEVTSLALGFAVYILTVTRLRQRKKLTAQL